MTGILIAAALTLTPAVLESPENRNFGTAYYDQVVRTHFQERVLVQWPGPTGLMDLWASGQLKPAARVSLLLGGAAFHDPQMLPIYREALQSKRPLVRQAAAYGYRDLIGDQIPSVRNGINWDQAQALIGELDAVAKTTRRATLLEIWLTSALAEEGRRPPDWQGILFRRSAAACLKAAARLARTEDLDLLVRTYEYSGRSTTRNVLLLMIEGLSMNRFVVRPTGQSAGWSRKVYTEAEERLDQWLERNCDLEVDAVLQQAFEDLGIRGLDPQSAAACDAWIHILKRGQPTTWAVASQRVYRCGGPAIQLSLTRPETSPNREAWKRLNAWFAN